MMPEAKLVTKHVKERRDLEFPAMEDIRVDLDALEGEKLRTTGNWTPAQNVDHVAKIIAGSIDGFDAKAPLPLRLLGPLLKGSAMKRPFKPGIKLPAGLKSFEPAPDVTWEQAATHLRHELDRVRAGAQMTARSPVFGAMTHDDWTKIHCRHAALHLSFIHQA